MMNLRVEPGAPLERKYKSTSAMITPSAGGATVVDGESCDVCCMVLAPKIRTEGEIGNCFVASHDTAPCGCLPWNGNRNQHP